MGMSREEGWKMNISEAELEGILTIFFTLSTLRSSSPDRNLRHPGAKEVRGDGGFILEKFGEERIGLDFKPRRITTFD